MKFVTSPYQIKDGTYIRTECLISYFEESPTMGIYFSKVYNKWVIIHIPTETLIRVSSKKRLAKKFLEYFYATYQDNIIEFYTYDFHTIYDKIYNSLDDFEVKQRKRE